MANPVVSWEAQLSEFSRKTLRKGVRKLTQNMALFVGAELALRTPVRLGSTFTHWVMTRSGPSTRRFKKGSHAFPTVPSNAGMTALFSRKVKEIQAYDKVYFTNNDEHMSILEEGLFEPSDPGPSKDRIIDALGRERHGKIWVRGGFSVQAPRGIARPAISAARRRFGRFRYDEKSDTVY